MGKRKTQRNELTVPQATVLASGALLVLDLAVKGNVPLQGWRTWEKTTMDSHNATPLVAVVILDGGNQGVKAPRFDPKTKLAFMQEGRAK